MGESKKLEGRITINGTGGDGMRIEIEDVNSGVTFIDLEMSYHEFSRALSNLASRPCKFEVRNLKAVGKQCHSKEIIIEIGKTKDIGYADRKPAAERGLKKTIKLMNEETGKEWTGSSYFGSKDSFFERGDYTYARTTAYYWE